MTNYTHQPEDGHEHKYKWVDAGFWSDDIAYCICCLCGKEKPGTE